MNSQPSKHSRLQKAHVAIKFGGLLVLVGLSVFVTLGSLVVTLIT